MATRLSRTLQIKEARSAAQVPYPTAWDFFFDQRESGFAHVHLTNGKLLGGYWGVRSYAGSLPNDDDIYLEAVYAVDDRGSFGKAIPLTRSVLLRKEQYNRIEFFLARVSKERPMANDNQQNNHNKTSSENSNKIEKGACQPLNEGYLPIEKRGYIPTGQTGLPKAPQSGTGESGGQSTPSNTAKTDK